MLYLILLSYQRPLAEVEAHLVAHRDYLHRHYQAGHFLLSGPQVPREGGVILARGGNDAEVQAWMEEDPFHQAGVAAFRLIAWQPTLGAADVPMAWLPATGNRERKT